MCLTLRDLELAGTAGLIPPVGIAATGADDAGQGNLADGHCRLLVWSFDSRFHLITSFLPLRIYTPLGNFPFDDFPFTILRPLRSYQTSS